MAGSHAVGANFTRLQRLGTVEALDQEHLALQNVGLGLDHAHHRHLECHVFKQSEHGNGIIAAQ